MSEENHQLREIIRLLFDLQRRIIEIEHDLRRLCYRGPFPTSFRIKELSPMIALAPGQSPVFTATPEPAGSSLGSVIPAWTSSDPSNITLTPDQTGLNCVVEIGANTPVGVQISLTISATDPKTGATATGTTSFTVVAAAPDNFPKSFTIAQTS